MSNQKEHNFKEVLTLLPNRSEGTSELVVAIKFNDHATKSVVCIFLLIPFSSLLLSSLTLPSLTLFLLSLSSFSRSLPSHSSLQISIDFENRKFELTTLADSFHALKFTFPLFMHDLMEHVVYQEKSE
jgi:hypothetical protein